jgi:hypothetical protein
MRGCKSPLGEVWWRGFRAPPRLAPGAQGETPKLLGAGERRGPRTSIHPHAFGNRARPRAA